MSNLYPNGFGLYDVPNVESPLLLSAEHAEEIGATPHKEKATRKAAPKAESKDS